MGFVSILTGLCMFFTACEEEVPNPGVHNNASEQIGYSWFEEVGEIIPAAEISFVSAGESIQSAIDEAMEGEFIYVESGIYDEQITLKKEVTLIGLKNSDGEGVELMRDGQLIRVDRSSGQMLNIRHAGGMETARTHPGKGHGTFRKYLISSDREDLGNGIAHYWFDLKTGEGTYDEIRIHRVVKERKAYHPVKTEGEIFMIHGASQNFSDIFLLADLDDINPSNSSPAFLAYNNIDVWGIDLGWTRVPNEETDLSFMENWGVQQDVDHTLFGMSVARIIRAMSGEGLGQLNLLGFSYGASVAYSSANHETTLHKRNRHIKGIIPVDQTFKLGPDYEDRRVQTCTDAATILDQINSGNYANNQGAGFDLFGQLALADPDGISPVPDFQALGLTNAQVPIFLGANTYFGGNSPMPFWHFAAGNGPAPFVPADDFLYTDPILWYKLIEGLPHYMPWRLGYELSTCLCDEEDSPYDDYLSDVNVPVLYIGANGGTGVSGLYSLELLGSSDVEALIITLSDHPYNDYGHGDLFLAENAPSLVWDPLATWLLAHH